VLPLTEHYSTGAWEQAEKLCAAILDVDEDSQDAELEEELMALNVGGHDMAVLSQARVLLDPTLAQLARTFQFGVGDNGRLSVLDFHKAPQLIEIPPKGWWDLSPVEDSVRVLGREAISEALRGWRAFYVAFFGRAYDGVFRRLQARLENTKHSDHPSFTLYYIDRALGWIAADLRSVRPSALLRRQLCPIGSSGPTIFDLFDSVERSTIAAMNSDPSPHTELASDRAFGRVRKEAVQGLHRGGVGPGRPTAQREGGHLRESASSEVKASDRARTDVLPSPGSREGPCPYHLGGQLGLMSSKGVRFACFDREACAYKEHPKLADVSADAVLQAMGKVMYLRREELEAAVAAKMT
jgi:hypothetical protein